MGPLLTLFSNPLPTPLLTRPLKNYFYRHFGVSDTLPNAHSSVTQKNCFRISASPKPDPSKPPCNMPQAKTEVTLQFSECCAAEVALQHWLFCSAEVIFTKSCAAASEKLQCNIEKAALQESAAFLPLPCGFQAPTFRHPRLGPAEGPYENRTVGVARLI